MAKTIKFMDVSFRDGFQSCLGARVKSDDFFSVLEAAKDAGIDSFEIGGGARFQSLYFYCQEDAFEMMSKAREIVGKDVNLQTLSRGVNVVGLSSQSSDIVDLHAKLFAKHGVSTIRNFDALNDVNNLKYSAQCITNAGINHQVCVTLMSLPPGMKESYAHTAAFYVDTLKNILESGLPFNSVCFKDASGTSTPSTVFETIKAARKLLGDGIEIEFHSHCTAGVAEAAHLAAINAGADIIDLAMSPFSGGTSHPDILTMYHALKGSDYKLDVDVKKIIEVEALFKSQMEKYFMPPEAKEISPMIQFSPMPGGALTANTQMMRDNNCLHLFPEVITEMEEVVSKGGFGTSVTPVSQFYFQQAFANVTQGRWKKITDGYGKMVLGYFGKTPTAPDAEIVKIASEQLGLEPTTKSVLELNDADDSLGIEASKKVLSEAGLELTDENIFIAAACGEKGITYLNGDGPLGIRYAQDEEKAQLDALQKKYPELAGGVGSADSYTVTVNGKEYAVAVAPGTSEPIAINEIGSSAAVAGEAVASSGLTIKAPMPGSVFKLLVSVGDSVAPGDTVIILEAMKMEIEVKATEAGVVSSLMVAVGDTISADQDLLAL
jgi:pyruvate carboxylase subunit B